MIVSTMTLRYLLKASGVCRVRFRLDRLSKLRKRQKLTQKELGAAVGVSSKMISNYENGLGVPDAEHLARLADALETNVEYLLDRTTYGKPLSDLHYRVWERFAEGDQNGIIDLLRKHLVKEGFGKKPVSRKKPPSAH